MLASGTTEATITESTLTFREPMKCSHLAVNLFNERFSFVGIENLLLIVPSSNKPNLIEELPMSMAKNISREVKRWSKVSDKDQPFNGNPS